MTRLVVRYRAGSASTSGRTQLFLALVRVVAPSVLKCASPTAVGGAGFRGWLVHGQDRGGFEDEPENANGPPWWNRAGRMNDERRQRKDKLTQKRLNLQSREVTD